MSIQLRQADFLDLDALHELERVCFVDDGFNRRQLAYLLTRAHGISWLIQEEHAQQEQDQILGYAMLLLRRGSESGRLYSFCLHPTARGRGMAVRCWINFKMSLLSLG